MTQKPQKLNIGDTIGIISPAGAIKETEQFHNAVRYIESRGYRIKIAPHALNKAGYLAGNDAERLSDIVEMFKDPQVKAIFCARGGYGTFRILDKIPHLPPKILVGYSDITALLNNLGFVTFHGPLTVSDFGRDNINPYTEEIFWKILENRVEFPYIYTNPYDYHCINAGECEGELVGGNLSIICGLLGTPYSLDFTGKILLIEDINEPLYKIDRMLTQLRLAGVFNKVCGILAGEFTGTEANELLKEFFADIKIPVGYGFPCGHNEVKATLPIGARYSFNSKDFKLELLENYLD